MNAPTAPHAPTIPTTASTVTAAGATSATPLRIDTFIKSKLKEARSDSYSGLKSSADSARSHGFTACANSRYADFLAAMSAAQDQVTYYAEKYPACFFLPWVEGKGKGRGFNSLSFHSTRHTCNTLLAEAGIPADIRLLITGHGDKRTNLGYTHLNDQTKAKALKKAFQPPKTKKKRNVA